jgi:hypothetical protein
MPTNFIGLNQVLKTSLLSRVFTALSTLFQGVVFCAVAVNVVFRKSREPSGDRYEARRSLAVRWLAFSTL